MTPIQRINFQSKWGLPLLLDGPLSSWTPTPPCQSGWIVCQLGAIKSFKRSVTFSAECRGLRDDCTVFDERRCLISHLALKLQETSTRLPGMRILACQWGDKFSTKGEFGWNGYIVGIKGSESPGYTLYGLLLVWDVCLHPVFCLPSSLF